MIASPIDNILLLSTIRSGAATALQTAALTAEQEEASGTQRNQAQPRKPNTGGPSTVEARIRSSRWR